MIPEFEVSPFQKKRLREVPGAVVVIVSDGNAEAVSAKNVDRIFVGEKYRAAAEAGLLRRVPPRLGASDAQAFVNSVPAPPADSVPDPAPGAIHEDLPEPVSEAAATPVMERVLSALREEAGPEGTPEAAPEDAGTIASPEAAPSAPEEPSTASDAGPAPSPATNPEEPQQAPKSIPGELPIRRRRVVPGSDRSGE